MIVTASAPIRVCDCGGWTDTWFAAHGRVLNIATSPRARVRITTSPAAADRPSLLIDAVNFGDRYVPRLVPGAWDRHPLLEATIVRCGLPDGVAVEVSIACDVPAGAGTGTSAAVTVALVGALAQVRGEHPSPGDVARSAHAVETDGLGQQSGIQDQICSAFGGINDITMSAYPRANVRQIDVSPWLSAQLTRRLALVFLGRGHRSSEIHEQVIARLTGLGPDCPLLEDLRRAAAHAVAALDAGDLIALGTAMIENTEGQDRLHPALICPDARRVVGVAREHGAAGWKVNGAGGDGGSLTLLGSADDDQNQAMLSAIEERCRGIVVMPVTLQEQGLIVQAAS